MVDSGICYGRSDLALADDPVACAQRLRDQLPDHVPLFTSPLRRCLALAQALRARPLVDARLIEMDFGAWEMQPWNGIGRDQIEAWRADPLDYAPPGGEPVAALRQRVRAFLDACRHEGADEIAAVSHAGVMKVVAAECLGLPTERWLSMTFDYCSVFVADLPA